MRLAPVAIAAVLSTSACANVGSGPQVTGSLEVEVAVEGRDDASGVTVTAGEQSAETGPDGLVFFEEVPAAEPITVRASLDDAEAEEIVTVEADQLVSVSLVLAASAGSVEISSMVSEPPSGVVPAGGVVAVHVTAEDSEGGELSYDWEVTDGFAIAGSGSSVDVQTPDEADVEGTVTVTVSNDAGGSASDSLDLLTTDCEEPSVACELTAYPIRHRISIDTARVDEPLTDVPILLVLEPELVDYQLAGDDGASVRLVDASLEAFFDHEIDTWDPGGTSYLWVRIPELPADEGDFELFLYYGDPSAQDGQNPAGVWDDDFSAVWHGNVVGDGPNVLPDSTQNANDGQSPLADWSARIAGGLIGRAVEMDGTGGSDPDVEPTFFEVAVNDSLELAEAFTLEAVVEISDSWFDFNDGDGEDWGVVVKGDSVEGDQHYYLGVARRRNIINCRVLPADDEAEEVRNDQPEGRAPDAGVEPGELLYLACTYDGADLVAYIDGERVDTLDAQAEGPGGDVAGPGDQLLIGARFGGRQFGGLVDEVRVSSVARSDAWLSVQGLTIHDPDFVAIGDAEQLP